ncbi:Plasma membrane proteolipid 3 [Madurella fahalii]|uniref:Plasma membrane proteolipid 3 n=1 Tax=Madurella fahalii TaxID=1157608 RepID=A0ABQ0G9H7_9PEZI
MDGVAGILLALICLFFPPLAVGIMAGCGVDLLINLFLTIWLWFPGVLHAFYLLWVYYDRRERVKMGSRPIERAPFVYSEKVQNGGFGGYSTIVKPTGQYSTL